MNEMKLIIGDKIVNSVDQVMMQYSSAASSMSKTQKEALVLNTVDEILSGGGVIFGYPPVITKAMALTLSERHLVLTVIDDVSSSRVSVKSVKSLILIGMKKILSLIKVSGLVPTEDMLIVDSVEQALKIGSELFGNATA